MKEDVLEQIVDDYLRLKGYFTIHNVRFKPEKSNPGFKPGLDDVPSDVDVVGFKPVARGSDRVWVVSCKAWQSGFPAERILRQLEGKAPNPKGKPMWKHFRKLWDPKWAGAFRDVVKQLTGADKFTYVLAVTRLKGDPSPWSSHATIRENLGGNPLEFRTLEQMWKEYLEVVGTTPQPSDIGRLAQLLKAAGLAAGGSSAE